MKALSFELNGRASYGIMLDGGVREAGGEFLARYPDLKSVLAANALTRISENLSDTNHRLEDIRFLPLIPNPDKIILTSRANWRL